MEGDGCMLFRAVAAVMSALLLMNAGHPIDLKGTADDQTQTQQTEKMDDSFTLEKRFRLRSRLNTQLTMLRIKQKNWLH